MKYVKKFQTNSQRTQYEGGSEYIEPYVSLVTENSSVHYNKPYLCKLTLQDGSKVKLYGSGELTSAMISSYKSTLVSAEIGELCTGIANQAFYQYTNLTSVTIPNSVISIGNYAFQGCSGLTSVTIGNNVTSIGNYAFSGCETLTNVTIPNNVTSLDEGVFWGCGNLTSIDIPDSVTSIGKWAFRSCSGLESVTIGSGVTNIGREAFYLCRGLKRINSDTDGVFNLPNSVTSIDSAFSNCSSLTSVIIPNSVTSIGDSAFYDCTGLESVTIGNSVTSIGNDAFYLCSSLTNITSLATTAPTIQSQTFQYVKRGGTLTVPSGSTGYDVWMGTGNYYLGKYNWTKVEQ